MSMMEDIINEASSVNPIMYAGGKPVYTFEDAVKMNKKYSMERKISGKSDAGVTEYNNDGITVKRTNAKHVAVDLEAMMQNRYRNVKIERDGNELNAVEVVVDLRAILEQEKGTTYTDNINTFIIAKPGRKIEVMEQGIVSSREFVNEFKRKFDVQSAMLINEVISKFDVKEVAEDKLKL